MNFIIPKTFRRAFPFLLVVLFSIFPRPYANADPVVKNASLTEYYMKFRSGEDREETDLSDEFPEAPKTGILWELSKRKKDDTAVPIDPWRGEPVDKSTMPEGERQEQDYRLEMLTPYFEMLRRWKNPPPMLIAPRRLYQGEEEKQKDKREGKPGRE